MQPDLLHQIPIYGECLYCGYVEQDLLSKACLGCGTRSSETRSWFPESAYEYVILLEDYHAQTPSSILTNYFEDNLYDMWTSGNPISKPTSDWKPITILLFRSLFELLLDHCLWKLIRVQLCPSPHADDYAYFVLKQFSSISAKKDRCYPFVTQSKWKEDVKKFGFQELDDLLDKAQKIRNQFIHNDPNAGHLVTDFSDSIRGKIPDLFSLFVRIANEYHHPYANDLSKIEIKRISDEVN